MKTARAAIFLDRDGTIIEEAFYLADPDLARLTPGAGPALRRLQESGFALIIVTNQSGIARGLYTNEDFHAVQRRVNQLLEAEGVAVAAVYYCPHHPDYTGPCACRKPGTLLFEQAIADHDLDAAASWGIGDRIKDLEPVRALGGRAVLVRTGFGAEHVAEVGNRFFTAADLPAAADLILGQSEG